MANKKASPEDLAALEKAFADLKAKYPDTRTNEQAVLDDYYNRQWAKQGLKNVSNAMMADSGIGPNPQSMFDMLFTKKKTDYLKGVKKPEQLGGITKPNFLGSTGNATSNVTSNTSNDTALPAPPATTPSYVGSNDWEDIVDFYFPKGAGNYRDGGKVKRSKPAQTYAEGGLVRGGGKALRGRGRGKMV